MTIRMWMFILFVLGFSAVTAVLFNNWVFDEVYSEVCECDDQKKALEECTEDIANKCSGLWSYATSLERENARLNGILEGCKK